MVSLGEEIPVERGHQRGVPLKIVISPLLARFAWERLQIDSRHRLAAYHNKHCWRAFREYQHRWPWMTLNLHKILGGFSELFAMSGCGKHFKSELCRNYWK